MDKRVIAGRKPIVIVGSINTDLVANVDQIPLAGETVTGSGFQIHPGGKGANQAVAVGRLGYPVRMIGCLGDDPFGAQLKAHLQREGVDTTGIETTPGPSGVAMIVVARNGENSIVVTPGANALVTPRLLETKIEILRSAGLVLAQLEIPLETVEMLAQICHRENVPLILDPAPARSLPPRLFEHVEWFTPNETETAFYLRNQDSSQDSNNNSSGAVAGPSSQAKVLIGRGVKGVALKMGSRGVYLASATGLQEEVPAFRVKAVDTTAAGDAFNGAFATGLMLRKGPVESARFAAAAAALSVTRAGAQPSMPTMEEIERFLASC